TRTAKEELASLKSEILSARAERDMNLEHIKSTKAELEMVTSQYSPQETRQINDQIEQVRLEISSINSEKGKKVYELDELQQKIVEAAGAVAAAINAKYEATRKELEVVKAALTRTKEELERTRKELDLLKIEIGSRGITKEF